MAESIFRVRPEHQGLLVHRPETGMGYQLLSLPSSQFALVIATVYAVRFRTRSELFQGLQRLQRSLDQAGRERPSDVAGEVLQDGDLFDELPVVWPEVVNREDATATNYLQSGPQRRTTSKSVELVHDIASNGRPKMFFRFCATEVDPRVDRNGAFVAGTYATTFNDLRMVPSGLAAVGRYALPIPESARYVRSIVTNAGHKMGTALPRFSQSGGGVEVRFENSAKPMPDLAHRIDVG